MSPWYFILILCAFICYAQCLDSSLCKETPKDKHCLIEYSVKDQWPHTVRYVYNWYTRKCFEIRWSDNCHAVPSPTTTNNFASEQECMDGCSGWA